MAPEMDELNKRRVERQIRRQKAAAQKRRKKTMITLLAIAMMIAGGVGLFLCFGQKRKRNLPRNR